MPKLEKQVLSQTRGAQEETDGRRALFYPCRESQGRSQDNIKVLTLQWLADQQMTVKKY